MRATARDDDIYGVTESCLLKLFQEAGRLQEKRFYLLVVVLEFMAMRDVSID
jgi:hypothetical protein